MTVLPDLRKAFYENPEMVALFGDLVRHAENAVPTLASGNCLTAKEAIHQQMTELRARLSATAHSELEKLLIDRICISWVAVYHADIALAEHLLAHPSASPATRAAQQRLDGAHRRFVSAVKALATVQKLLQRAPSPLELLTRTVSEKTTSRPSGRSRTTPVADGVPVLH